MQAFTIKNAIVLSLVQVTTVVFGILAAGVSYKLLKMDLGQPPSSAPLMFVRNFGVVLMVVPLMWIGVAAWVRVNRGITDAVRGMVFVSGFVCQVMLLLFLSWAVISPWMQVRQPVLGRQAVERVSE